MELNAAIQLIEKAVPYKVDNSQWADLGCGAGTFTIALSYLLGSGSRIFAIDKKRQSITSPNDVEIEFFQDDFLNTILPFSNLQGIMMANSFHYIKNKLLLVEKLSHHLRPDGQFIIVEYDTDRANQWVPYPLPFSQLNVLFNPHGFSSIEKIGEYNSVYNSNKMYACVISR